MSRTRTRHGAVAFVLLQFICLSIVARLRTLAGCAAPMVLRCLESGNAKCSKAIRHCFITGSLFVVICLAQVTLSPVSSGLLIPVAQASNYGCENPPVDEPDGDGDECANYTPDLQSNDGGNNDDTNINPTCCGDPIVIGTGNNFQQEDDFVGAGPLPLKVSRYYDSQDNGVYAFGANWHGIFSRSITVPSSGVAKVMRDDGRILTFTLSSGIWTSNSSVNARLVQTASGWTYTTALDETETYDTIGRLITVSNRAGLTQSLAYDANGNLASVTDPFGRQLQFSYVAATEGGGWLVSQATTPDGSAYVYSYDSSNNLVSVRYPDNSLRQYVYENSAFPHALTGIIDENGTRYATFAYDASGRTASAQHAGGADLFSVDYTYFDLGYVAVTNPSGATYAYYLDSINGFSVQDVLNRTCSNCYDTYGTLTTYYDANGNISSQVDFNNVTTTHTFDLTRNLETARTEAYGTPQARTITTSWDPTFRLPAVITEPSRTTSFSYDTHGNVLQKSITAGSLTRTWSYTYNANGQMLSADGPRTDVSDVTSFAYDSQGNLISITNALGQVTHITSYDANGRPLAIQDPNGLVTTLTYNFRGQVTSRTVGTELTSYSYDAVGDLTRLTLADGSYLTFSYDAAHRLTGVADALGNHITYTLDAAGNRTQVQSFDLNNHLTQTRSHAYDQLSELSRNIGALNQTTSYYSDSNGNLLYTNDPLGHLTSNSFDSLNRLIQVTDPANGVTHYSYDAQDHLTSVTDPRNLQTTYAYDGLGDLLQAVSPDTGTTTYTYDGAGNVATKTDARSQGTTYSYDALNRLMGMSYSSGTPVNFLYDSGPHAVGKLVGMTDGVGLTQWTYDALGRVSGKSQLITSSGIALNAGYSYDGTGRPAGVIYPSGKQVSYGYDNRGRINAIYLDGQTLLSGVQYAPFSGVTGWTWGNGGTYGRTIDTDGRIAGYTLNGSARTLTYDAAGRLTAANDAIAQTYSYDALDRLTGYTAPGTSQAYGYDADGNRISLTIDTNTYTYTYPSTSNRLTSVSGPTALSYIYDAAGNITTDGSRNFSFDPKGRMTGFYGRWQGVFRQANFALNGLGQRSVKQSSLGTANYFYDEAGHLLGEYDNNGVPIQETVYLGDIPVALFTSQIALIDNSSSAISVTGTWATVSGSGQGGGYRTHAAGTGTNNFKWLPTTTVAGSYHVYARWVADTNRATNAPYTIATAGGNVTVTVDQQQNDNQWILLGTYTFNANQTATVTLTDNANGTVVADAVKLVAVGDVTVYNIHTDQLNTPRVITDASNTIVWRWDSDPFGTTAANEDPDQNGINFTYNLRFPGQLYDKEMGTHYNYYRDYDPTTGRYVESDPIGLLGGINTYNYVEGSPLSVGDPLGLCGDKPSTLMTLLSDPTLLLSVLGTEILGGGPEDPVADAAVAAEIAAAERSAVEIVASNGTRIMGFTNHGIDRAIGDAASRAGVKPEAILDALKNPVKKIVEGVDKLGRPFQIFTGANARVIVNPETGRIVSTNPLSGLGAQ